MGSNRADIIAALQRDILLMQGCKPALNNGGSGPLQVIRQAFPQEVFPTAAIHEWMLADTAAAAATTGFISGILSSLLQQQGMAVWVSRTRQIYPNGLSAFGIHPEQIVFIHPSSKKDIAWTVEEALKCDGLTAVIADIPDLTLTECRRLQLAVEHSKATGFLLRNRSVAVANTAVARWRITPAHCKAEEIPGVTWPGWKVELLKIRNGRPGTWMMEWYQNDFRLQETTATSTWQPLRKVV